MPKLDDLKKKLAEIEAKKNRPDSTVAKVFSGAYDKYDDVLFTVDASALPSIYYIYKYTEARHSKFKYPFISKSFRIRSQHGHGPTITSLEHTIHLFAKKGAPYQGSKQLLDQAVKSWNSIANVRPVNNTDVVLLKYREKLKQDSIFSLEDLYTDVKGIEKNDRLHAEIFFKNKNGILTMSSKHLSGGAAYLKNDINPLKYLLFLDDKPITYPFDFNNITKVYPPSVAVRVLMRTLEEIIKQPTTNEKRAAAFIERKDIAEFENIPLAETKHKDKNFIWNTTWPPQ